ncbi:MAG: hypothetical protein R2867_02845 [Caldilineaceae bacterium]
MSALASMTARELIGKVEERYQHALAEQERLQKDLAQLTATEQNRARLARLKDSFAEILEDWGAMAADEQREVTHLLIEKIGRPRLMICNYAASSTGGTAQPTPPFWGALPRPAGGGCRRRWSNSSP